MEEQRPRSANRRSVRWIAGALVLLAAAVVAASLIVTSSQRPVNVNIRGPLTVCTTSSLGYGNTC
jgi:hypothetical protein